MTVHVFFFAAAREITRCERLELELGNSATIADVQQLLKDRFPELDPLMTSCSWSVDQEYSPTEKQLYDGAEIGMILPVSGG